MEEQNKDASQNLSKHEKRVQEHQLKDEEKKKEKEELYKSNKKTLMIGYIVFAVILIGAGYSVYALMASSSKYDGFAQCLRDKGAIIYGNDFCQYTGKQLAMFGSSAKKLNYVKCAENKNLCDGKDIKITPTWEINGNFYKEVQQLQMLSELTGCKL